MNPKQSIYQKIILKCALQCLFFVVVLFFGLSLFVFVKTNLRTWCLHIEQPHFPLSVNTV